MWKIKYMKLNKLKKDLMTNLVLCKKLLVSYMNKMQNFFLNLKGWKK